jgi:hypothetical protein
MVVIDKDSVSSNTWETVYDELNTYVSDPKSRGVKWIFGAYPDVKSKKFPGFPVIVIESPSISLGHESIGKAFYGWGISISVSIYTDWAQHVDQIFDQIMVSIREHEKELEQQGLYLQNSDTSDISALDFDGNRVYLKTIVFRFKYTAGE